MAKEKAIFQATTISSHNTGIWAVVADEMGGFSIFDATAIAWNIEVVAVSRDGDIL